MTSRTASARRCAAAALFLGSYVAACEPDRGQDAADVGRDDATQDATAPDVAEDASGDPADGRAEDIPREAGDGDDRDDLMDVALADLAPDDTSLADVLPTPVPPPLPPRGAMRACLGHNECSQMFVVAHRGLRREGVPENSLASLRAAAAAGVPMAEIDIRTTADGVLVLMHDTTVDRTTDGRGEVASMTWEEVQGLTLRGGEADEPGSRRVPTFDEALELAAALGVALYLDIKNAPADALVDAVREADMLDMALFRRGTGDLAPIAAREPNAWLLAPVRNLDDAIAARDALPGLRMVEVAGLQADATLTAALREAGFAVQQDVFVAGDALYTIRGDSSGWQAFVDAGVQLLQSDRPVELGAFLESGASGARPDR